MRLLAKCALLCSALALTAPQALGVFHLWRISELYTDSTGNVQFIEMFTTSVSQQFLSGQTIVCTVTGGGQSNTFTFPSNSCAPTNNRFILLATSNFASLPGGVTPDYIIPANFLFKQGGTINFGAGSQVATYGALPTDGVNALRAPNWSQFGPWTFAPATNTPTNCAGVSGSVNVPPPVCVGDINGDAVRNTGDLTIMLGSFGLCVGQPGYIAAADLAPNGCIDTADLVALLAVFGVPCP